ncbi:MAG: adenylosuccinate synthetase [Spirochaetes bacterium]|nr:adenylosuccinate synthetase [Spirochaetota bacterium]
MPATIVVDALWGDSGKGKIASFLAQKHRASLCARAGTGTNAGHSLYLEGDRILKTHQLPLAGILSGARLRVGSGVAVDPRVFFAELEAFKEFDVASRARVDGRCPVILPGYAEEERSDPHLSGTVGSTCSGTGVAQAAFCLRKATQAKEVDALAPFVCDVAREINETCARGETVIVEGSQGTFLSLALSRDYPYCTSGNCTAVACADDVGLSWRHIREVVLVVKAVPSRIGAGPLPGELSVAEQDARGIAEYGVLTGRRRRKASSIPMELLKESVLLNGATKIALTFCDHLDPSMKDARAPTGPVRELVRRIEAACAIPVFLLDCGKPYGSILQV